MLWYFGETSDDGWGNAVQYLGPCSFVKYQKYADICTCRNTPKGLNMQT
jgi:hypothetical protein